MKKHIPILILVVGLLFLLNLFLKSGKDNKINKLSVIKKAEQKIEKGETSKSSVWQDNTYLQIPAWTTNEPFDKQDPRWVEWQRREKEDRMWQWKMPIKFYGKVVDENDQPVAEANINFDWNDMSPHGTSYAKTASDAQGLFSLEGVTGRILGVYVNKEGYYTFRGDSSQSFEYAQFFEANYHTPDPNNPVIFRLRKKREAESLLVYEKEFRLAADQSVTMDLLTGNTNITPTTLQINLLPNEDEWTAQLSMVEGGGIQINTNEFPFEAPEEGYQSEILITYQTSKPSNWQNPYKGGSFFVKTSQGYALVELKTLSGKRWIKIKPYFNPSGSRNLEFDETKKLPGSD